MPDDAACFDPPKPGSICGYKQIPTGATVSLDTLLGCANEMQNCACNLIGSENCTSITTTGQIVLGTTEDLYHPARGSRVGLDSKTGEVVIKLDKATAKQIKKAATYTTDDEINRMRLEYNPDLFKLTSAVALLDASRRLATEYRILQANEVATDDVFDPNMRISKNAKETIIAELWAEITSAITSCKFLEGRPTEDQPDALIATTRDNLICSFRHGTSLSNRPVLKEWPGCNCNKGEGRMVRNTCITTKTSDHFAEQPIDTRVPRSLDSFILNLESSTGFKVKEVGLIGCGFQRLETGSNVKNLPYAKEEDRALYASHISDHSRGTACDLSSVTFQMECQDWIFMMSAGEKGAKKTPFFTAMVNHLVRRGKIAGPDDILRGKKYAKSGIGKFYRELEDYLGKQPMPRLPANKKFSPKDDEGLQLRMGVAIRNALTDAGFIVYDPTVNSVHTNHLHFETPSNDQVYFGMAGITHNGRDKESVEAREKEADPELRRAAGVKPQP